MTRPHKHIYSDKDGEILAIFRRDKCLKYYVFLCTVKSAYPGKGSFTLKEIKQCGYTSHTVDKYLKWLIKKEWVRKFVNAEGVVNYVFKSWIKICSENGVYITAKNKFKSEGDTMVDTIAPVVYSAVKRNCEKQIRAIKRKKKRQNKAYVFTSNPFDISLSVIRLSKIFGYRSASSGVNWFRRLERDGCLTRERRKYLLGYLDTWGNHIFTCRPSAYLSADTRIVLEEKPCLIKLLK